MAAIQSPAAEEVHPDVALVARAKAGDTAAFEQLVRQYERQIFRVAQHITQNREDAEDITQDVFLKAYEKLDGQRELDAAAQTKDEQDGVDE